MQKLIDLKMHAHENSPPSITLRMSTLTTNASACARTKRNPTASTSADEFMGLDSASAGGLEIASAQRQYIPQPQPIQVAIAPTPRLWPPVQRSVVRRRHGHERCDRAGMSKLAGSLPWDPQGHYSADMLPATPPHLWRVCPRDGARACMRMQRVDCKLLERCVLL